MLHAFGFIRSAGDPLNALTSPGAADGSGADPRRAVDASVKGPGRRKKDRRPRQRDAHVPLLQADGPPGPADPRGWTDDYPGEVEILIAMHLVP
jgi:hypothetical protein